VTSVLSWPTSWPRSLRSVGAVLSGRMSSWPGGGATGLNRPRSSRNPGAGCRRGGPGWRRRLAGSARWLASLWGLSGDHGRGGRERGGHDRAGDQDAKATAECFARAGCHARLLRGVGAVSRVFATAAGSDRSGFDRHAAPARAPLGGNQGRLEIAAAGGADCVRRRRRDSNPLPSRCIRDALPGEPHAPGCPRAGRTRHRANHAC
jgi:hypothetical protein